MLKTSIISFVPDCIATPLLAEIHRASRKGKALKFQQICSRAYKASSDLMTETAIPLYFSRNIGQNSAAKLVQFNSIQTAAHPIIRPKKTVVKDNNRMYHTGFPLYTSPCYPSFPLPLPEARGQLGQLQGPRNPLQNAPMPAGNQLAPINNGRVPANLVGESLETRQWREVMEAKRAAEQQVMIEPMIAYTLLTPHQGMTQENGELYTIINVNKTRVVNMSEDVTTPQFHSSAGRAQPLNRQQLRQLQYDPTATPTSTRPQEWIQRDVSLEQELEELQLEGIETQISDSRKVVVEKTTTIQDLLPAEIIAGILGAMKAEIDVITAEIDAATDVATVGIQKILTVMVQAEARSNVIDIAEVKETRGQGQEKQGHLGLKVGALVHILR
jgi:hypothetical protein